MLNFTAIEEEEELSSNQSLAGNTKLSPARTKSGKPRIVQNSQHQTAGQTSRPDGEGPKITIETDSIMFDKMQKDAILASNNI